MSDAQRAQLTAAVEQLAWSAVREMLGVDRNEELPDVDLRQMWLAALTSLLTIRDSAEQLAASAALSAAQRGADYPAIGDAAGMTRQGARRKWPGLAGLSDERQRKLAWWQSHRDLFAQCVRGVLETSAGPRPNTLRDRLDAIEQTSPAQHMDAFDMALVDAHAVALDDPGPAGGRLAAVVADAYAAMNSRLAEPDRTCETGDCRAEPVVGLWGPDLGHQPAPTCRSHAVEALRHQAVWIVAAYRQGTALPVFAEACS